MRRFVALMLIVAVFILGAALVWRAAAAQRRWSEMSDAVQLAIDRANVRAAHQIQTSMRKQFEDDPVFLRAIQSDPGFAEANPNVREIAGSGSSAVSQFLGDSVSDWRIWNAAYWRTPEGGDAPIAPKSIVIDITITCRKDFGVFTISPGVEIATGSASHNDIMIEELERELTSRGIPFKL